MTETRCEQLKRRLADPKLWPLIGDLGTEARDAIVAMERDLERKASSLATVSNALSHAESQASEWRCKAGTLGNELRRAELDKAELQAELSRLKSHMRVKGSDLGIFLVRNGQSRRIMITAELLRDAACADQVIGGMVKEGISRLDAEAQQYECNACDWKGKHEDTVMLGSVGPLCPVCRETTEATRPEQG